MGDYRHQADQSLPPRYGNSPGADYLGGVSQIHAAKGSRPDLYGTVLPNGDRVYNLDAQVAAHYTIRQQLADPEVPRTTGANSYADTIAQRHDIECWYAADQRDRMLQGHKAFERSGRPGEYRTWAELSGWEQGTNAMALAAAARYHDIRTTAEIEFLHGLQEWKPEGAAASYFKNKGVAGFEALAGSYPAPYRERMLGEMPALRDKGGRVDFDPLSMVGHAMGASGLKKTEFEQFATLPLSDRERDFFHPSIDSIKQHGAPVWEPHPDHPANQAGAMAHGRFRLGYTDAQGHRIEKVLDLDQGRRFSTTTSDPATGQTLSTETKMPTGPLIAQNYFTPSYAIEARDGQGQLVSQSKLPEGKNDHPSVDGSPLYREALRDLEVKYREIRNDPDDKRTSVIIKVEEDIKAQHQQAQQHYLAKDHPLYQDVVPHPHGKQTQQEQPQAPAPTVEPRTTTTPTVAKNQPLAASITHQSSIGERFKALVDAIQRKDDKAYDQVLEAHQASPQWQAFQQQSRDHEQALIAQQQREREQQLAAQRQEEAQQQQQRGPVMGR
ncbi:hypothetical protein [Variovorax sp. LT1R16]|uniref:hypothetical protein n=1 Tax=Variovorax sp. LT1R16 TaxID=3443728 RepID=UPI003F4762EC